jgi:hypothetical protein
LSSTLNLQKINKKNGQQFTQDDIVLIDNNMQMIQDTFNNASTGGDTSQLSNSNLLINCNFKNPVNQRVITSWINSPWVYTIDRWRIRDKNAGKIEITSNGLTMSEGNCNISQTLESNFIKNGSTVTLSAKVNEQIEVLTCLWDDTSNTWNESGHLALYHGTVELHYNISKDNQIVNFEWVKLELGSIATPFVPRLYVEELALCQRYTRDLYGLYRMSIVQPNYLAFSMNNISRAMRTIPTLVNNGIEGTDYIVASTSYEGIGAGWILTFDGYFVLANKSSHNVTDGVIDIKTKGKIFLDNEIY